jgi:hypothetical protein
MIVVEGQTEEAFVKEVLKPHLDVREIYTSATIVGKVAAENHGHRQRGGGWFKSWAKDIRLLLKPRDADRRVTTLFDLYHLPTDFPGLRECATQPDTVRRCQMLEDALATEFESDPRFIPYIQRHEFEALVFADLPALREWLDAPDDIAGLSKLEADVAGVRPEDINDGDQTAPSKRLSARIPGYSKPLHGPSATANAGLPKLRAACPRFDAWVAKLERLNESG